MSKKIEKFMREYLKSKGIDPDRLDRLSEKEFKELCVNAQIDAYLKGKSERKPKHKK
jgi:hypothetical protein